MFWKKKPSLPSAELARLLQQDFVGDAPKQAPAGLRLTEENRAAFEEKILLYRKAVLMLAMVAYEAANPGFTPVREQVERALFTPDGEVRREDLKSLPAAIADFRRLVTDKDKKAWSLAWLEAVGVAGSEPALCLLFADYWTDLYASVGKALRGVQID